MARDQVESRAGAGVQRLVVLAHFDPDGLVAPHVRRQILAWQQFGVRLIVVTTAALVEADRSWLAERCELIERANYGYDFFSYREGLLAAGDLGQFTDVVVCNDTFVGPLRDYAEIFSQMADVAADFWGMAVCRRHRRHVQSYFVVFRPQVVASGEFAAFWEQMKPLSSRRQVIRRYEVGMSGRLQKVGFRFAAYFKETRFEQRLARLRVMWWVLLRPPSRGERSKLHRMWQDFHEPWNPASALADSALRNARYPVVKIDTLRHDPYGLGAERLLASCEKAFPNEFAGVAEYLARTKRYYPTRKGEALRKPPWWLKPFGFVVRYR